jgi:hypothetical protein
MTFPEVVAACAATPELVENFNRLTSSHLGKELSPLERLIDNATGYGSVIKEGERAELRKFVQLVYDCIWTRVECGASDLDKQFADVLVSTFAEKTG